MGPGFESQRDHTLRKQHTSKPCKTQFLQGFLVFSKYQNISYLTVFHFTRISPKEKKFHQN